MKKFIFIIFSLVILSSNANSDISPSVFLEWLKKNDVKVEDINLGKVKFYRSWIPEENVKPNYETLVYELLDLLNNKLKEIKNMKLIHHLILMNLDQV